MRILIFNTLYYPYKIGGAEISVQILAENLARIGIEVGVVTLATNDSYEKINGVRIWRCSLKNIYWIEESENKKVAHRIGWHLRDISNTAYEPKLEEIYQNFKPDLVHTNNLTGFSVYVWEFFNRKNIPIIHTLRDYYLQCPKLTKFKKTRSCSNTCLNCKLFSYRKKQLSKLVNTVIGISDFILNEHINDGYFKDSFREVIYNAYETRNISQGYRKDSSNNYMVIGFIGQVNPSKGIELLITSLAELIHFDNWHLKIAGNLSSGYKKFILNHLPKSRITFTGYIEKEDFFKSVDLLIVPSLWKEPFGRVVIEALSHQVPILGSNQGGIPELLGLNKNFIFNPYSDNLKMLLCSILQNPAKLNEFEFSTAELEKYTYAKQTEKYLAVYKKSLKSFNEA